MKKSMVDYISALSNKDFSILEEIVRNKYEKFTELYWILREHSDDVKGLTYHDTSKDVLKIEVEVSRSDLDEMVSCLLESVPEDGGQVEITGSGKKIHITIRREEKFKS